MEIEKPKDLRIINIARWIILLDGLFWLLFAIIVALDAHPSIPDSEGIRWAMAVGALLTSAALIVLAFLLRRASRVVYYLTLGLLVILSFLTVTDQFGVADLVVLVMTVVPLVLLLKERRRFLED